jgi:hypothetical protein
MKNMNAINATSTIPLSTWLRTDRPVIPVNPETWDYLPELGTALQVGVVATADSHHPGFYELEIGHNWYYIHVPTRLNAVYIVAVQNRLTAQGEGFLAHQRAC